MINYTECTSVYTHSIKIQFSALLSSETMTFVFKSEFVFKTCTSFIHNERKYKLLYGCIPIGRHVYK